MTFRFFIKTNCVFTFLFMTFIF